MAKAPVTTPAVQQAPVTPAGGQSLEPSFIARVAAGVRYAITGKTPDGWFGPAQPLAPVAPPEVAGRRFDYPFAGNLSYRPRSESGENAIGFATLRRMADPDLGGLDLLRLAIETRKDQIAALTWSVKGRDGKDGGARARAVELALRRPDRARSFLNWQRELVEDLLVLDAPTIYLRPMADGTKLPEILDGATIKPLLSVDGRTPLPPDPAYQQNLKGLPAVDYTTDELVYAPRNTRSNRIYGYSPVQQLVNIVDLALRRALWQLQGYTVGQLPEALIAVPETWNPDQISNFQAYWDAIMSGDQARLRSVKFVPGGMTPTFTKDKELHAAFDEWLARIICYCFSLSPQQLVPQMNRATAETSKDTAQAEGIEPLKLWHKDVMDQLLGRAFNAPELEWSWVSEEIPDPVKRAQVFQAAGGGKAWMTQDEIRERYGLEEMTPEQREELNPAPPMMGPGAEDDAGDGTKAPSGSEKVAKARRSLRAHPPAAPRGPRYP